MELAPQTEQVDQSKMDRTQRKAVRLQFVGDGRIPSGILVASMTGVRLSFRGSLGQCPFGAFYPDKNDPNPSSGPAWLV